MSNYIQEINISIDNILPEDFSLSANWKDHMIRLNDIHEMGNKVRVAKGLSEKGLENFLRSPSVNEFFLSIQRKEDTANSIPVDSTELEIIDGRVSNIDSLNLTVIKNKRGRYGGTWGHPLIALRLAAWMDSDLEVEIYSQFLEHKIVEKRIESSDAWNKLRHSYSTMIGESFRFYHFVHVANAISEKLNCNDWDTADSDTLAKRTKIQDTLSFLMDSKVIKSREALLKTISKMTI